MSSLRVVLVFICLGLIASGLSRLESARGGLVIAHSYVVGTPVATYRLPGAGKAPAVVMAHGLLGARQRLDPFALSLAQAGYVVVSYDLLGHGRHPEALTGRGGPAEALLPALLAQLAPIVDHAAGLLWADGQIALLGQGLGAELMVQHAARDSRIGPVIAVDPQAPSAQPDSPDMLLMLSNQHWGTGRAEAQRILHLTDPNGVEGRTVAGPQSLRRAVIIPLPPSFSQTATQEARDWLNLAYGRSGTGPRAAIGTGMLMLFAGLFALAWPLSRTLRQQDIPPALTSGEFWLAALIPAAVTPLWLSPFHITFSPVMMSDYLTVHLLLYGALSIAILQGLGHGWDFINGRALALLIGFGLLAWGAGLDRYVVNFLPAGIRPFLTLMLIAGAIAYCVGEAILLEAGAAGPARALVARLALLGSLAGAALLSPENNGAVLILLPGLALFFAIFGTWAGLVGRRCGSNLTIGVGLGVLLGWSLGVIPPMFTP